jgi:hypothetical protein
VNIGDIRRDIVAALRQVTDLNVESRKPASVSPPCAILGALDIPSYHDTFEGRGVVNWPVTLVVADAADGSLDRLDRYLVDSGAWSIVEAVEDYAASAWTSAMVRSVDSYGVVSVGGVDYMGCRFLIEFLVD